MCCKPLLHKGLNVRLIGLSFFLTTLAAFVCYLLFLEEIRNYFVVDLFSGLATLSSTAFQSPSSPSSPSLPSSSSSSSCASSPYFDMAVDSCMEFSLIANALLVCSCNRWLAVPWLVTYVLNIGLMVLLAIVLFLHPVSFFTHFQLPRVAGLIPLIFAVFMTYCWTVVKSWFNLAGSADLYREPPQSQPLFRQANGIARLCGGVIAIVSALLLMAGYMKLDSKLVFIDDERGPIEAEHRTEDQLLPLSRTINFKIFYYVFMGLSILSNLFLVVGGSGQPWRRALLIPWLLFFGLLVIVTFSLHQWFTSQCWVRDKIYGLVCLIIGAMTLLLWSVVWMVAAEATSTNYNRHYPAAAAVIAAQQQQQQQTRAIYHHAKYRDEVLHRI